MMDIKYMPVVSSHKEAWKTLQEVDLLKYTDRKTSKKEAYMCRIERWYIGDTIQVFAQWIAG